MRSIDLTSIPKKGQFYDWMRSVGCICHIIWDGVELDFMIIDVYRKNRATYLKIISNHRNAKEVRGLHFRYLNDLTLEEFTYYNCEQWLKDNELWDIFVSKNKVV